MVFKDTLKKFILSAAMFAAVLLCLGMADASVVMAASETVAAQNVYVENICVAGMNEEVIQAVIDAKMAEYSAASITINVGSQSLSVTAGELGLYQTNTNLAAKVLEVGNSGNIWKRYSTSKELESTSYIFSIDTAVSEDAVRAVVSEQCTALNVERSDMSYYMGADACLHTTGKQNGIYVNEDETTAAIVEYMSTGWYGGYGEINASVTIDEAEGEEETYAVATSLLGSCTTEFTVEGSENRCENIRIATEKINGTVLLPGEEFSVLETIEPFTEEEGYKSATAYEMGTLVKSYGGGVCQVSSTLYGTVLKAELDVTERNAHSMLVSYVDVSLDAAVSEGTNGKDFKFINDTDYPIYIEGIYGNGYITFNIYGYESRDASRTVEFVGEVHTVTEYETVYELDYDMDVGYYDVVGGSNGTYAVAYKIVYENGEEISRTQINSSNYNVRNHTVSIGVNGASDELIELIQAAADEQDLQTINILVGGIQVLPDEDEETEAADESDDTLQAEEAAQE